MRPAAGQLLAFGFEDGEKLPLTLAIENLARIVQATDLPVSIDLESGYSSDADGIARSIEQAIAAGAVGCNMEDSAPGNGPLRSIAEQTARFSFARAAAQSAGFDFFINARCDVFLQAPVETHTLALLELAIERGHAYAKAGASGLFLPGLQDLALIEKAVQRLPLPVNIMLGTGTATRQQLADIGASRISHGPGPYALTMQHFKDAAASALR